MASPLSQDDIAALVAAAAKAVDLTLKPEHLPGVQLYFGLAASQAELVNGFRLDVHDEPANVFVPRDLSHE